MTKAAVGATYGSAGSGTGIWTDTLEDEPAGMGTVTVVAPSGTATVTGEDAPPPPPMTTTEVAPAGTGTLMATEPTGTVNSARTEAAGTLTDTGGAATAPAAGNPTMITAAATPGLARTRSDAPPPAGIVMLRASKAALGSFALARFTAVRAPPAAMTVTAVIADAGERRAVGELGAAMRNATSAGGGVTVGGARLGGGVPAAVTAPGGGTAVMVTVVATPERPTGRGLRSDTPGCQIAYNLTWTILFWLSSIERVLVVTPGCQIDYITRTIILAVIN
jgi:hypothetical protein